MAGTIAIIGGGIAGLSAGCYGQMNGYSTQIYEMHNQPGGLCAAWQRQGYTFDGCMHWLVGSAPHHGLYRMWQELGAVQGLRMVDPEEFVRIEGEDGRVLHVYTDIDRLEAHLLELAPGDAGATAEVCSAVRTLTRIKSEIGTAGELQNVFARLSGLIKMAPFMGVMARYARMTIAELAAGFSDPLLSEGFSLMFGIPEFAAIGLLMTLAWMSNRCAGYPIGGSLAFAQAIARRYESLGGEIRYGACVERILLEGDRAVGVQLAGGEERRADNVLSAADLHAIHHRLLGGRYLTAKTNVPFEQWQLFSPLVQVSLGVARDMRDEPRSLDLLPNEPIFVGPRSERRLSLMNYASDPTMVPEGKTALAVRFATEYPYWAALREKREDYRAEKARIAEQVIDRLDRRYPGLKEQVEAVDVATPTTWERYTGNWQASFEGWLLTPATVTARVEKTIPGLQNLYLAGQWLQPGGGLPTAAMTARDAIQLICHKDRRPFTTTRTD
ncbi:MAG: phytoene desaturase family protein [Anaerolineae bacterium]